MTFSEPVVISVFFLLAGFSFFFFSKQLARIEMLPLYKGGPSLIKLSLGQVKIRRGIYVFVGLILMILGLWGIIGRLLFHL